MKRRPRTTGGLAAAEARGKSWSCLCQAANPFSLRWDESQHKRSGHCCSIDYQWKMSDSLSQASLFNPLAHRQTELKFLLLFVGDSLLHKTLKAIQSSNIHCTCPSLWKKQFSNLRRKRAFVATHSIIHRSRRYHSESSAGCLLKP